MRKAINANTLNAETVARNHERLVKALTISRRMVENVVARIPEKAAENLDLTLVLNVMNAALSELEQEERK